MFEVTVRILNRSVTEGLLDCGSPEFQDFSQQLMHEVKPGRGASEGLSQKPNKRPVRVWDERLSPGLGRGGLKSHGNDSKCPFYG